MIHDVFFLYFKRIKKCIKIKGKLDLNLYLPLQINLIFIGFSYNIRKQLLELTKKLKKWLCLKIFTTS